MHAFIGEIWSHKELNCSKLSKNVCEKATRLSDMGG